MVREPEYYVGADSPHAHRTQVATSDASWDAKNIGIEAKIAEITAIDAWVGLRLKLCLAFGMRPKESGHLRPHGAVIGRAQANPRDAAAFPECAEFLRIQHGTKGGRLRDVPLTTDGQRELLARVTAAVAPGMYVGRPGFTSTQNASRFYYVIRKCGIAKKQLGVMAYGLRHQFVNDAYEAETGSPSPVRGGVGRPIGDTEARARAPSCWATRAPARPRPTPMPSVAARPPRWMGRPIAMREMRREARPEPRRSDGVPRHAAPDLREHRAATPDRAAARHQPRL